MKVRSERRIEEVPSPLAEGFSLVEFSDPQAINIPSVSVNVARNIYFVICIDYSSETTRILNRSYKNYLPHYLI